MEESKEIISYTPDAEGLIARALDKGVAVETMEKLLAMRKELKAEQAREAYYKALAQFQAECPVIPKEQAVKNKDGVGVRYKFAPLDIIISTVKSPLKNNGFSYSFTSKQTETTYTAICNSHHIDGHSESTDFTVPIEAKDYLYLSAQQKVGSARSFADRYAFCNAYGILTGDEDNDAQGHNGNHVEPLPAKKEKLPTTQKKTADYRDLEQRILIELEEDCFTGKIDMDDKQWDLDEAAINLKKDLADNTYAMDGLAETYDMIARMSLIAQERDKVQVDEKGEEVLSDGELEFGKTVDDVKLETEGNLSE